MTNKTRGNKEHLPLTVKTLSALVFEQSGRLFASAPAAVSHKENGTAVAKCQLSFSISPHRLRRPGRCDLNKHKGGRAFDIWSTSAPAEERRAPDPRVSPQKKKRIASQRCSRNTEPNPPTGSPRPSTPSAPPSSLSLCA